MKETKKVAWMHRHDKTIIPETNQAFPYVEEMLRNSQKIRHTIISGGLVNRFNPFTKFFNALFWLIYAPFSVREGKYDVIYCDDSFPFYCGLVKAMSPESKVILRLGDYHLKANLPPWLYRLLHPLEIAAWNKIDLILAISKEMAEEVSRETYTKVKVILDPVEIPETIPPKPDNKIKRVIFYGTLTENKGLEVVIKAAAYLPNVDFYIIGDGPNYERLVYLKNKECVRNVHFTGWVKRESLDKELAKADVGLAVRSNNPANDILYTSPFLKYLALRKLVVASDRKILRNLKYPYRFTDAKDLAREIEKALKDTKTAGKWHAYVKEKHNAIEIAKKIFKEVTEC